MPHLGVSPRDGFFDSRMNVHFERPAVWICTLTILILTTAVARMPGVNDWAGMAFIAFVALLTAVIIWVDLVSPTVVALIFVVADVFAGAFG